MSKGDRQAEGDREREREQKREGEGEEQRACEYYNNYDLDITSEGRHSGSGFRVSWRGSGEMELLTPPKILISTHVVVCEARLEACQLGLVQ